MKNTTKKQKAADIPRFSLPAEAVPLLSEWYRANARLLPWRVEPTPYRVWVSEIMLQQTRVEAVKGYFERFMQAFPTVADLAAADEERLLSLWEGLGYYSRARNLQKAAQRILSDYGGELPRSKEQLLALSGIGAYTAGAILSFAYDIPAAAVDGNVLRVVARLCDREEDVTDPAVKSAITAAVEEVLPLRDVASFNSGLLELGQTVCLPNTVPLCERCPLRGLCLGCARGTAADLPHRGKKAPRKIERHTVALIYDGKRIALFKRPAKGLLAGMWEPLNLSGEYTEEQIKTEVSRFDLSPVKCVDYGESKHLFTHKEWHMQNYLVYVNPTEVVSDSFVWVDARTALTKNKDAYAIPSAFSRFLYGISEEL